MTVWIVLGPSEHGVVMLAERICAHLSLGAAPRIVRAADVAELLRSPQLRQVSVAETNVHVHFTDRLFGSDCRTAATAFAELATLLSEWHAELSVTLHDLPTRADDSARFQRRALAYHDVITATTGRVIVSSAHEAGLLAAIAPHSRPVVIPLPIDASQHTDPRRPANPTSEVTILGFLYPGNGHAEVLAALPSLPTGIGLTALGRVADGHQPMADDLSRRAREVGRRFVITGWVAAKDLAPALRRAAIPIVGPRQISASASIGSWLSAGRRPLVPDTPYTRELLARMPGALTPYEPDGIADSLRRAHADPGSTWLAADTTLGPSTHAVASAYRSAVSASAVSASAVSASTVSASAVSASAVSASPMPR